MVAKKKAARKVKSIGAKGISSAKAKTVKGGVGQVGAPSPNLGPKDWIGISPRREWGQ